MIDSSFPWLTGLIVVPLVGAGLVVALPAGLRRWARPTAVGSTLANWFFASGMLASAEPKPTTSKSEPKPKARRTSTEEPER